MIPLRLLLLSSLLTSCSVRETPDIFNFDNSRILHAEQLLDDDFTVCLTARMEKTGNMSIRHKASAPGLIFFETGGKKYVRTLNKNDLDQLLRFCAREIGSHSKVKQCGDQYDWVRDSISEFANRLRLHEQNMKRIQE